MYSGIQLQNMRDSVDRIKAWLNSVGKTQLSNRDMEIYQMLLEANGPMENKPMAIGLENIGELIDGS